MNKKLYMTTGISISTLPCINLRRVFGKLQNWVSQEKKKENIYIYIYIYKTGYCPCSKEFLNISTELNTDETVKYIYKMG